VCVGSSGDLTWYAIWLWLFSCTSLLLVLRLRATGMHMACVRLVTYACGSHEGFAARFALPLVCPICQGVWRLARGSLRVMRAQAMVSDCMQEHGLVIVAVPMIWPVLASAHAHAAIRHGVSTGSCTYTIARPALMGTYKLPMPEALCAKAAILPCRIACGQGHLEARKNHHPS